MINYIVVETIIQSYTFLEFNILSYQIGIKR